MDEFLLTVNFRDEEFAFPTKFLRWGYTVKLEVDINGTKVLFEPDEEQNWRALISYEDLQNNKAINKELLQIIAVTIEEAIK